MRAGHEAGSEGDSIKRLWKKCSPHNYENLSSDLQHPHLKNGVVTCTCSTTAGEAKTEQFLEPMGQLVQSHCELQAQIETLSVII